MTILNRQADLFADTDQPPERPKPLAIDGITISNYAFSIF